MSPFVAARAAFQHTVVDACVCLVDISKISAMTDYEQDLASMTHSGPHELGPPQQELNRVVFAEIHDIIPIDDIHKISDCDLIYKFLIACRWQPDKAVHELREYVSWRRENRINEVLWEQFPPEIMEVMPFFQGVDKFGFPLFYDRPSPANVGKLLAALPREDLIRGHLAMMEQGRRLCKAMRVDRVSCVLDMSLLNMSIVTNPSAVGLLKEFSKMDQKYYPENMRTMMITNSGWTFGTLYKVIRPLLDERVQKKIHMLGSGAKQREDMAVWTDLDQVPVEYGGDAERTGVVHPALDVSTLLPATPPIVS